jgi:hypothetical protein
VSESGDEIAARLTAQFERDTAALRALLSPKFRWWEFRRRRVARTEARRKLIRYLEGIEAGRRAARR